MASPIGEALLYALLPVAATTVGGIVASVRVPGPRTGSAIEHFAAGVILAAVAAELLPDALHARAPWPLVIGCALAVALMLGLKAVTRRLEPEEALAGRTSADEAAVPWSFIIVAGLDTLLDGALLGIGFTAGAKQGVLLTVALTIETLALGLSVAAALGAAGVVRQHIVATVAGLSALFGLGALVGVVALSGVTGAVLTTLVAFGSAILIYLVTEELLVEAHEVPETAAATILFFAGFMLLLLIDMSL